MKAILSASLATAMFVSVTATGHAEETKQARKRPAAKSQALATKYPNATPRQRRNSEAYDRGEYYEMISEQHAFGSRSWWILKEREQGSARN